MDEYMAVGKQKSNDKSDETQNPPAEQSNKEKLTEGVKNLVNLVGAQEVNDDDDLDSALAELKAMCGDTAESQSNAAEKESNATQYELWKKSTHKIELFLQDGLKTLPFNGILIEKGKDGKESEVEKLTDETTSALKEAVKGYTELRSSHRDDEIPQSEFPKVTNIYNLFEKAFSNPALNDKEITFLGIASTGVSAEVSITMMHEFITAAGQHLKARQTHADEQSK